MKLIWVERGRTLPLDQCSGACADREVRHRANVQIWDVHGEGVEKYGKVEVNFVSKVVLGADTTGVLC